jgi:hypothetical protein
MFRAAPATLLLAVLACPSFASPIGAADGTWQGAGLLQVSNALAIYDQARDQLLSTQSLERFQREARAASALNHPSTLALRPNEATVLYNLACVFCSLQQKPEALDALRKAWQAGFRESDWARRDVDLSLLHSDPEFDKLYPATATSP